MKDVRLILDNIRSVHNVGSIFRTAEAFGVMKIYCIGTTPVPIDRFGQKRKDLAKVALGAEDLVSWEYFKTANSLVNKLKKEGFLIVAIEQDEKAVYFKKIKKTNKVAYIFGNEREGVSEKLLKLADQVAEIPMKGKKESLNVSVTAGIILSL